MEIKDLTGQTFGRVTAIECFGRNKHGEALWLCRCDCGTETTVRGSHLRSGNTQSCGCRQRERMAETHRTHGGKGTRLYRIWESMKQRCQNSNRKAYRFYGAKGVRVCAEWQEFEAFRDWALAHGYTDELTIGRIGSNKDYCSENCRWITQSENSRRASSKPVKCLETGEIFLSATEASKSIGLNAHAVSEAIRNHGASGGYHWQYKA